MEHRAGMRRALLLSSVLLAGCGRARPIVAPAPPPTLPSQPAPPVARIMTPRERFVQVADSLLAQEAFRSAHWGVLIVEPETRDTIYARNADKLFIPASNQKLITGATALAQLGTAYRFSTTFAYEGRVRGSVLRGNLLVTSDGDPSVSAFATNGDPLRAFDPVVAELRRLGIRRIEGAIGMPPDLLPGPTVGYAWEADDLDGTSGAAVDELFFNEGEFSLTVRAGARRGALVTAQTAPLLRYPRVRVEARVAEAAATRNELTIGWDSTGTVVLVTGTMAPGSSRTASLAYRHPSDAWRAALTEALARGGITITGRRAAVRNATPVALAALTPMPFADVLRRMEKPSQNQIAEILFRTAGRVKGGEGTADSAQRVVERQLAAWGVPPDQVVVRDGSGLSRHNFVTPTAIVRVLDVMRTHPDFSVFYDALPIAGRDGTIGSRMRGTPAEGNVRAKTGTLSRVRALSGYVTTPDGRTLLISFLCNNFVTPTREVDRVVDALAAQLATLRLERRE